MRGSRAPVPLFWPGPVLGISGWLLKTPTTGLCLFWGRGPEWRGQLGPSPGAAGTESFKCWHSGLGTSALVPVGLLGFTASALLESLERAWLPLQDLLTKGYWVGAF